MYSERDIYEWIYDHQCVEFDEEEATYFIHINKERKLVPDVNDAIETVTKSVDISEWANDDSPERFYDEFETEDNPKFVEMVKEITKEINEG